MQAWSSPGHMSAALQIGFAFGFWTHSLEMDECSGFSWFKSGCSFITETQHETVSNTNCTWICPICEFFNFSDSFFGEQVNLETENRFVPLRKEKKDRSSPCGTNKKHLY